MAILLHVSDFKAIIMECGWQMKENLRLIIIEISGYKAKIYVKYVTW